MLLDKTINLYVKLTVEESRILRSAGRRRRCGDFESALYYEREGERITEKATARLRKTYTSLVIYDRIQITNRDRKTITYRLSFYKSICVFTENGERERGGNRSVLLRFKFMR